MNFFYFLCNNLRIILIRVLPWMFDCLPGWLHLWACCGGLSKGCVFTDLDICLEHAVIFARVLRIWLDIGAWLQGVWQSANHHVLWRSSNQVKLDSRLYRTSYLQWRHQVLICHTSIDLIMKWNFDTCNDMTKFLFCACLSICLSLCLYVTVHIQIHTFWQISAINIKHNILWLGAL